MSDFNETEGSRSCRAVREENRALRLRLEELEGRDAQRASTDKAYCALVDHSLQGLVIFQDGRAVFANQAVADITGYCVDEILAMSPEAIREFVHPEDRKVVWERCQKRLAGEPTPERYEMRGVRKDGGICWLEIHASQIHFRDRPAIQAAYVDITERKRGSQRMETLAQAALGLVAMPTRADVFAFVAEKVLALIGEGIVSVHSIEGNTLTIRKVMGAKGPVLKLAERLLGGRVIGLPIDGLHEEARTKLLTGTLNKVEGGLYELFFHTVPQTVCKALERAIGVTGQYSIGLRQSGRLFGNVTILAQKRTEVDDWAIEVLVNQASIVLERREAEEALRRSEARLTRVIEGTDDAAWEWPDLSKEETWWSPRFFELLGYRPNAFTPTTSQFFEMMHPDDRALHAAQMQSLVKSNKPFEGEYRLRHKSGTYRWFHARGRVFRDETGRPICMSGSVRDISREKLAERELESSHHFLGAVLNSFPGNVAVLDEQGVIVVTNSSWVSFGQANGLAPRFLEESINYLEVTRSAKGQWSEGIREVCEAIEAILRGEQNEFHREYPCHSPDQQRWFDMRTRGFSHEGKQWVVVAHIDVTERKELELNRELSLRVLAVLNRAENRTEIVRDILKLVKAHHGFTAVAIRLRDGDDYPYFVQNGFPDDFVRKESPLCVRTPDGDLVRDEEGRPLLECMCGNVIQGRVDPSHPFFTKGGSFWTNGTTELLATTTEKDRQARTRNRCNREGYESVALIPLRSGDQVIGLLQMNDVRPGRFTEESIRFFEGLGASIGIAIAHRDVDQALRKSEEKHRDLVENINDVLFTVNAEGIITYLSPPIRRLTGYAPEELVGRPFREIIHSEDLPGLERSFRDTLENRLEPWEFRYHTKDGQSRWACTSSRPISQGGLVVGIRGVFSDITERKRAEQAMRDSEMRYRRLFESAKDGILILDADTGQVVDVNPFLTRLLGYSHDTLCGQHLWEIGSFKDIPFSKAAFETLQQKEYIRYETLPLETCDGRRIDVEFISNVYLVGQTKVIQCNIRDITERKQREAAIRHSEAVYRKLHESLRDGFVSVDMNGRLVEFNGIYREMLGYSEEELGQLTYRDLTPRKWHDVETRILNDQVLARGYSDVYEKEYRRKDGTIVPIELRTVLVRDAAGQPVGMWAIVRDITERKRAEQRLVDYQNKLRELTARLTVAQEQERRRIAVGLHDSVAQGLAMMKLALQSHCMTADEETNNVLARTCSDIDGLVDEIRALSFELSDSVLYEVGLCEAMKAHLERVIGSGHGLACHVQTSGDFSALDINIIAALFRSFRELIANVVKHAQAKNVHVRLERTEDTGILEVKDDGRGSSDVLLEGNRGHFGLFSIREQITALGGKFEMYSEPGRGTCITITVPVQYQVKQR